VRTFAQATWLCTRVWPRRPQQRTPIRRAG
jgi:hypothetical protein